LLGANTVNEEHPSVRWAQNDPPQMRQLEQ
jgi:hypothetical protein